MVGYNVCWTSPPLSLWPREREALHMLTLSVFREAKSLVHIHISIKDRISNQASPKPLTLWTLPCYPLTWSFSATAITPVYQLSSRYCFHRATFLLKTGQPISKIQAPIYLTYSNSIFPLLCNTALAKLPSSFHIHATLSPTFSLRSC